MRLYISILGINCFCLSKLLKLLSELLVRVTLIFKLPLIFPKNFSSYNKIFNIKLSNLKIFAGDKHDHEAQKPELIDFVKLNRKNKVV